VLTATVPRVKVGYVVKMYPRFSETFILNEVLAHEAAGADLHLVSLRPPLEGRFHEALADVRAPVTYLSQRGARATDLWDLLQRSRSRLTAWEAFDDILEADLGDAVQALELAELVEREGLSHLHAHFGSVATTVARLAARLTGVPYTFTAHAKDIFHEEVDGDDLRRKLSDAAATITVSDFNRVHLRAAYGSAADRVVRIYNGIDLVRFPFSDPCDRPPVIACVGRLVEKKGLPVLVEACGLLRDMGRQFRCDIVGAGPLADDLARRIESSDLTDFVILRGPVPQGEVRRIVGGAAVFAAPCVVADDGNRDGLPTVLIEAMALGTPCVATDVTGISELVRHGSTGLIVPQNDAPALAEALGCLLDDAATRRRLARSARSLVEAEFDIDRQAALMRELFVGCSERRDRGAA
jgi:glycosyltransferase involved in cell wall biosynthesis